MSQDIVRVDCLENSTLHSQNCITLTSINKEHFFFLLIVKTQFFLPYTHYYISVRVLPSLAIFFLRYSNNFKSYLNPGSGYVYL